MWMLFALLSVGFTALNLHFAVRKSRKCVWATACSLSFTALTVLSAYGMVDTWVRKEDWTALMDVVPAMHSCLTLYVALLVFFNGLAAAYWMHHAASR